MISNTKRDNMFFSDEINQNNPKEVEEIKKFLSNFNVIYDRPDKTYVIRDRGQIIATGSADRNVLKYFFVSDQYKGQGAIGIIYNSLLEYLFRQGYNSYFVFTTPDNKIVFESLGLKEVHSTDRVSLFEGGFYNYGSWIRAVKKRLGPKKGKRGAIIMNCNPMTLGHKYLIKKALGQVDELIIFVVEEDRSIFPFIDRFKIMEEELKEEKDIRLIKSGPYIISQGTFPTYFIKRKDEMLKVYTELDGGIFANRIGKDLEIDVRFLGSEPTDQVTLAYNHMLEKILKAKGIEVQIIPRKALDNQIISASHVRALLKEGRFVEAYKFLPKSSIDFLKTIKGKEIIAKLQEG